mgnify:CR=1 FL=1
MVAPLTHRSAAYQETGCDRLHRDNVVEYAEASLEGSWDSKSAPGMTVKLIHFSMFWGLAYEPALRTLTMRLAVFQNRNGRCSLPYSTVFHPGSCLKTC